MDAACWWIIRDEDASDAELVRAVQAGEGRRFGELVRRHARRVNAAARLVLGDAPEADDAAQQAFVQAYLAIGTFAGAAAFSTWLVRIALNEAHAIARRRRRERTEPLDPAAAEALVAPLDPEQEASAREALAALERALSDLPRRHREVLELQGHGLGAAALGARLGVTEPAARLRLHRARRALLAALHDAGPGPEPRGLRRRRATGRWNPGHGAAGWTGAHEVPRRALEVSPGACTGEGCT